MDTPEIDILNIFDFPIQHFPDRSARWLLQDKENVRGLIDILNRHANQMEINTMAEAITGTLLEQGKAQGIEQERRAATIRHILAVLKMKFSPDIVNALTPALREISEVERLEQLLLTAAEAQSLETFAQMLQE